MSLIDDIRAAWEIERNRPVQPEYSFVCCSVCKVVGYGIDGGDYADRLPSNGWPVFPHRASCTSASAKAST